MNQESVPSSGYKEELKRVLTLKDLAIYGIAFMTPIAPAYIFGSASQVTGGTLALAYAVAMIAMLFTAYSYGRMAGAYPIAGSTFSYTQKAISPNAGFFAGWAMFMSYVLVPLVVFMVGAAYANALVPAIPYWVWVLIIGTIVVTINFFGVQIAAKANIVLVAIMGAIVLAFIIICAYAITQGVGEGTLVSTKPFFKSDVTLSMVIAGGAIASFSFLGFDSITTMAEEAINPKKDIGKAAIIACLVGGTIFIVQAYVATLAWPDINSFESADTALFEVAKLVGGATMASFYTFAVILSTLSAGITGQSSAARLLFAMGRDNVIPKKFFTHLHPKYKTPINNIALMCVIAVIGALTLDISLVTEMMNFGGLFGFMAVNVSVILLFFFKNKEKKVFKNLILPALGFSICFYLWINLSSRALLIGFAWLVIGLIYALIKTKGFKESIVLSEDAF
ncbi:MAG: APC family permease [Erysipelotrichales bacterium]